MQSETKNANRPHTKAMQTCREMTNREGHPRNWAKSNPNIATLGHEITGEFLVQCRVTVTYSITVTSGFLARSYLRSPAICVAIRTQVAGTRDFLTMDTTQTIHAHTLPVTCNCRCLSACQFSALRVLCCVSEADLTSRFVAGLPHLADSQ